MLVVGGTGVLKKYFNLNIVDPIPLLYQGKINISLSFSFYIYCLNPTEMINKIIKSNIYSISISSIHDIVPSIIKTNKYYTKLKNLHFIKCSKKENVIHQIIEVNYILYKKYFIFNNRHVIMGKNIIKLYKKKYKIGVHVRLNDTCLKLCKIEIGDIQKINNIIRKVCKKNCYTFLSSFNNNFSNLYKKFNKNTYTFNSSYKIKHSSNDKNFNQIDVDKIVLDIFLTSNCDAILLSGYSTFSLLILYKGYYRNYTECNSKYYIFWNSGELYDHVERFRNKKKCRNITLI